MKRSIITPICVSVVAAALLLPAGLQGLFDSSPSAADFVDTRVADTRTDRQGSSSVVKHSSDEVAFDGSKETDGDSPSEREYVPGEVLVSLNGSATAAQVNELLASLDYVETKSVTDEDVAYGFVELQLAEGVSVQDALGRIADETLVAGSQPNYIYHTLDYTPVDSSYASTDLQAGASADLTAQTTVLDDTYADALWGLEAVHAYEAWDYYRSSSAEMSVIVAVLDSGLNIDHEDFDSSRIVNPWSYIKNSNTVADEYGHGTHVAGIIAATANNGTGVAGVSYNAKIMPVQVTDSKGDSSTALLAKGLQYSIDTKRAGDNVRVVNISIGTVKDFESLEAAGDVDGVLAGKIEDAHQAGLLIVYAAGNGAGSDYVGHAYRCVPCDFDEDPGAIGVISVAKTGAGNNVSYTRSSFSNYNMSGQTTKDLSAPGSSIVSTMIEVGADGPSVVYPYKNGDSSTNYNYGRMSGTSMATPYVAGIAALLFAADPSLTPEEVRNRLCDTAKDLNSSENLTNDSSWDLQTGYGLVDAEAALRATSTVSSSAPVMQGAELLGYPGDSYDFSIDNGDGRTWTWTSSDSEIATVTANENTASATVASRGAGEVTITATSNDSIVLNQNVTVIHPVITGPASLLKGSQGTLSITEYAANQWEWASSSGKVAFNPSSSQNVTITPSQVGNETITATLKNNAQVTATYELQVTGIDLEETTVEPITPQLYTGNPIEIDNLVVVKSSAGDGTQTLAKGTDYTLSYSNNTDVGTATITITGVGAYVGSTAVNFDIYFPIDQATITLNDTNLTYNGNAQKPGMTVTIPAANGGTKTLVKGVDYSAAYEDNINASTSRSKAKAILTGLGNYTGQKTVEFSIEQAELSSLYLTKSKYDYTGYACTPTAIVYGPKFGKAEYSLAPGVDYMLTAPAGRIEPGVYTYSATGAGNYKGTVSTTLTINANKTISDVILSQSSYEYDGTQKDPTVMVRGSDGKTLVQGIDYTLYKPDGRTNAGEYYYTIKPKGDYSGNEKTVKLTIDKAPLSRATITLSPTSFAYTGSAKTPIVTVKMGNVVALKHRDYTVSYANNVNPGTNTASVKVEATKNGNFKGYSTKSFSIVGIASNGSSSANSGKSTVNASTAAHRVQYNTHVQNVGWQGYVTDGATSGTSGRSLRLEGIHISLKDHPYSGSIQYRTHIQSIGWESGWKSDGAMSGTSGRSLRLEAIQIRLTGEMANRYDVYYRVHAQNFGWMGWAKNGAQAGTAGYAYRLEAIQVKLVPKGGAAPGSTSGAFRNSAGALSGMPDSESIVLYRTHVQNDGWQNYMRDGEVAGTSGRSLRLEGINIKLGGSAGSGGVEYRTHIQNIGWESSWKSNGAMSGTAGRSLRLEAIQIRLTGQAAQKYDVYYRVHAQNFGWMGWAKNGAQAGTAGYAYRLEAIQVKLVPKGASAPGPTSGAFRSR